MPTEPVESPSDHGDAPPRQAGEGSVSFRRRTLLHGPGGRLVLALVSVGLSLAAAEIGLRRWFRDENARLQRHRLFCEYDEVLGWRKIPFARGRHTTDEYDVLEVMNSKGLRGPEYEYGRARGRYRVLVLGDSFAEGYTVELEETFAEVTRAALARALGREVEVINAGTGGWSTDQELLFFESEGVHYEPDLTVLAFSMNDVWFNGRCRYWRGAKPCFDLRGGRLVPPALPVPRAGPQGSSSLIDRAAVWLSETSELYARLDLAWSRLAGDAPDTWEHTGDGRAKLGVYRRDETPAFRRAWALTEALLARLAASAARARTPLLVLYVPPREAIYADDWSRLLRFARTSDAEWDASRPRDRLAAVCARLGLDLVDPTPELEAQARREPDTRLYFRRDEHWTRAGHRLAGEVLATAIARRLAGAAAAARAAAAAAPGAGSPASGSSPR